MTLPGTAQVKKSALASVSLQFFCHSHQSHIVPVWIAGNGEVLPACRRCLEEEVKDPLPAEEKEVDITECRTPSSNFICMTGVCKNTAPDSFVCAFCGMHHCKEHFNTEDGICSGCEERLL